MECGLAYTMIIVNVWTFLFLLIRRDEEVSWGHAVLLMGKDCHGRRDEIWSLWCGQLEGVQRYD